MGRKAIVYPLVVGGVFCVVVLAACIATAGMIADELAGVAR